MLKIGEFAKLTGISIHMLRHYDEIGLLMPYKTDEETGYRYYSEEQIMLANQIQVLKALGFGLKEIDQIHLGQEDGESIRNFLVQKIEEKKQERTQIDLQIKKMRQALLEMEQKEASFALEVTIKQLPARKVASLTGSFSHFEEEGILWNRLAQICGQMKVRFADVNYCFAITHELDFEKSYMKVEVQKVVDRLYPDMSDVKFFEVPACRVATVAFKGQYSQIGNIKMYMDKWLKQNGYQLSGLPFSTYYRSPGNEVSPKQFITELCFPVVDKAPIRERRD